MCDSYYFTDDLSISLPENITVKEIAEFVIEQRMSGQQSKIIADALLSKFGVLPDDVDLVLDRVLGGIARAATYRSINTPDRKKDPIAFASYKLSIRDHRIIAFFYPEDTQTPNKKSRPWWKLF